MRTFVRVVERGNLSAAARLVLLFNIYYSEYTMIDRLARTSLSPELATIRALRLDMALQIARHVERTGLSQVAAARALAIPQPTLSKIIRGRIDDFSLELLIRIATRAQLPLVLQTGKNPAEAGVFVGGSAASGRVSRSRLTERAKQEISASVQRLSPEQRLDAQLRHCQLLAELRRGAEFSKPKRA